jgi:Domain of unknown function (DUF5666)
VRTLFALTLAAAFALVSITGVSAQTTTTTPPPPATEKKSDDKMEKKAKHIPSKSASGTVKSATADSVVVAGKEKGKEAEWTFGVDSGTKIRKSGKAVTAADLKPGDNVSVKYHEMDGKTMAQSIAVRGGMAKKSAANTDKAAAEKK